jgi:hypothetical protein
MENAKNAVATIFRQSGGVTRLARMIGAPVTTVHKWKMTGKIPDWRWPQIEQALRTSDEFKDLNNGAR